ncbi:MAG: hypothetical protein E2O59_06330 [Gammaproteobacteria bacterium]|nr:MAG: hypothetical protein E2O59_06330 [Gammaproteobacteria bacterium]
MRFLFGLIIGAMLTILAASVINAPTQVVVNDIREAWHELVDKVQQSEQSVSGTAEVRTEAKIEPNDWSARDKLLEDNLLQLASQPPPETDVEVEAAEILAIEQNVLTESSWPSSSYASQSSSATIWEPFHSQVSATGFAKRLSLQLGYPFQVTKDGPARYLVVFHYKSDEERALLVQQVATLTGYRAP